MPSRRTLDKPSLTAGLVLIVLGSVLLADALNVIVLRFAGLAPIALGAVGAILLVSGLGRGSGASTGDD